MTWRYVILRERKVPPCPACASLGGVVRLRGDLYACLDCTPRRAFEATWEDGTTPLPVSVDDLTDPTRDALEERLAGVGKAHRAGYERGFVDGLLYADAETCFKEWKA